MLEQKTAQLPVLFLPDYHVWSQKLLHIKFLRQLIGRPNLAKPLLQFIPGQRVSIHLFYHLSSDRLCIVHVFQVLWVLSFEDQ